MMVSVFHPSPTAESPGGGSLQRADLIPAADSAPGVCFSVARYRLLHHTAVSFVSFDIRVFCYPLGRAPGASGGAGNDVVDVRSALHPTAVHAPLLVPLYVAHDGA